MVVETTVVPQAYNFIFITLKVLFGLNLFIAVLIVLIALVLLISDLAEETDEEPASRRRYVAHNCNFSWRSIKSEEGTHRSSNLTSILAAFNEPNNRKKLHFHADIQSQDNFRNLETVSLLVSYPLGIESNRPRLAYDNYLVIPETRLMTFKDLGGIGKMKHILYEYVLKPFVLDSKTSMAIPRGILLVGGKGSGKTSISQAIVSEIRRFMVGADVKLYKVEGSKCIGSFIGSGVTFRHVFHKAMEFNTITVILIENIDKRFDSLVTFLMSELESIPPGKVLVIATARNRDSIDNRLVQIRGEAGKFDYIFDVELPDFSGRVEILKIHFNKRYSPITDKHIAELARFAFSFNAGELEKLASLVNMKAIKSFISPESGLREPHNDLQQNNVSATENYRIRDKHFIIKRTK